MLNKSDKLFKKGIISFLLLVVTFQISLAQHHDVKTILDLMLNSIKNTNALKYKLKATERQIDGTYSELHSQVKMQARPKRNIYLFFANTKQEIIWKEGWNKGNALINPGGFPFINLNLDPYGSLMRKGNHHTLHELGLDYFASCIDYSRKTNEKEFYAFAKLKPAHKQNNIDCYEVLIDNVNFKYIKHTVGKNENLVSIARKFQINETMILFKNKLSDFYEVKPGQVILIPNTYGRQILLIIDKKTYLPIVQRISDENGVFEQYEFFDVEKNPSFKELDFSDKNPAYGF